VSRRAASVLIGPLSVEGLESGITSTLIRIAYYKYSSNLLRKSEAIFVTPQVVDKFASYSINLNPRHPERSEGSPERSEGSPEFGSNLVNLRSFTAFRMTNLGSYVIFYYDKKPPLGGVGVQFYSGFCLERLVTNYFRSTH
jgi:hypothetical protein